MNVEEIGVEIESDAYVKPQNSSSGGGCITYTPRKRARSRRSSSNGGGANVLASDEVEKIGIESDIDVKPQTLPSGGGCSAVEEGKVRPARIFPSDEGFYMTSGEVKNKDIGWEHGETILPGNRFSWKCKWCGLVRSSGGVTRLKKHLAGARHIKPCLKVPEHVARAMRDNLLEMERKQLKKQREKYNDDMTPDLLSVELCVERESRETDLDVQMINATQRSKRTAKSSMPASELFRDSNHQSMFVAQQYKNNIAKVSSISQQSNGAPERSRFSSQRSRSFYKGSSFRSRQFIAELAKKPLKGTHDKDGLARKDNHWRNILENILHSPDVREGGGIGTCIIDALKSGPLDLSSMFKMADVTKYTADPECEEQSHCPRPDISASAHLNVSDTETCDRKSVVTNTQKCREIFLHILRSEKFVSMCDLIGKNFQDVDAKKLFEFSQINSRMKNGVYGMSPGLFNQDIQQVWRNFHRIGQDIVLSASDLSNISEDFLKKVVGDDVVLEAAGPRCEENNQLPSEQKNYNDMDPTVPFPSCESNPSTKPDGTEVSVLDKVSTCKQCGSETDRERSLVCDECEAAYHLSCAKPPVQEIPARMRHDSVHDNCGVCDRLEFVGVKESSGNENSMAIVACGSRESSVSSMESDEPPEPSRTALSRLCKHCATCEDDDRRFLVCGHSQCPYKFYHIRCLKASQIASLQQRNRRCWYCPSCLCRACFVDRDDDKIVLCDGCDEAYHTYCMNPPRASVPDGWWYCIRCNVAKAKEGMRRYEEQILRLHGKDVGIKQSDGSNRPMDVLLSAVEKLSSEEGPAIGKLSSEEGTAVVT